MFNVVGSDYCCFVHSEIVYITDEHIFVAVVCPSLVAQSGLGVPIHSYDSTFAY